MQSLSSQDRPSWLAWFLRGLLLVGFALLLGRLVELQVIKGDYFLALAEGNRIRKVPITAGRGTILARGGEVLVENKEIKKRVVFDPTNGFKKSIADENSDSDELITEWSRHYVLKENFAHVSGYLGPINDEEIGKVDPKCSEKGPLLSEAWVGRGGLEEQYSCLLRGIDGEELVEVDTFGEKIRTIGHKKPVSGQNISTTIDYGLQKKVAEIMKTNEDLPPGRRGAVIATDGKGEILAYYSSPSFDPNAFLHLEDKDDEKIAGYFKNENLPLFNRVSGGTYHPGSIFKLVTSIAGLEEGKITKETVYQDTGVITVNQFSYSNWYFTQYGGTEGSISLRRALARSTDTYFYKLGEYVGVDNLVKWAKIFGMGRLTGLDIPGEVSGLIPTPEWKKEVKGEGWFLGNTYHMSIGQGDMTVTPLEGNIMTSVIANNGSLCIPRVVNGKDQEYCQSLPIKPENIKTVKEGMIQACQSGGTAFPFFDFEPQVACKTGTAETVEEDKTHAWFTVFAPAENPQIVLTILIEKGGEGSSVAAPVAKDILQYYFHERQNSNN